MFDPRVLNHRSGLDHEAMAAEVGYERGATLRTRSRQRFGRSLPDSRAELSADSRADSR